MDVGVIGTGNMGQNHARVYSEMRGIGQIYVFDMDSGKKEEVAKKFECESCGSMKELLSKVDATNICVPTSKHFEVAKAAMETGVNVLIEKPVTKEISEAKELIALAEKEGLVAGVGHIERFNPVVREVKKLLEKPLYFEIKRHNPGSFRITDTDVVQDLMVHDIDIAWNYIFQDSEKKLLSASGIKREQLDFASVNARMGLTLVNLSASRLASKKIRRILVEEEDKTIEGDLISQEVYIHKKPENYSSVGTTYKQENIVEKVSVSKVEPLRSELKLFIDSVKGKTPFEISLQDGLKVLEVASEIEDKVVS